MPDDLPAGPDPEDDPPEPSGEPSNRDIMSYLRTHLPGSVSTGDGGGTEPGDSPEMTFEGDPEPIIEPTEIPPGTVEDAPTLAQHRRGFPSRRTSHGAD